MDIVIFLVPFRHCVKYKTWIRGYSQSGPTPSAVHLSGFDYTHTHRFNGHFPGLPRWAGTRKVKPVWILLKQETVSGNGISWAICKSAPRSRQITMPVPRHSVFCRPDALPATQQRASKHWRHNCNCTYNNNNDRLTAFDPGQPW